MIKIHTIGGGGGLQLHVREWGNENGPAILLIHGWSQSHLCWQRQYESALGDEFRIVALDNRGHGMSEAPVDPAAYADSRLWADDIANIIATLRLDKPVLAGWSYGGLVMTDYVRTHGQDGIAGINFVGAATELNEDAIGTLIGGGFPAHVEATTSSDMPTCIAGVRGFLRDCFAIKPSEADFETALCYNMTVKPETRANLATRELRNDDVLEALHIPVLATHGRADIIVLPAMAERILDRCPTAKASWYDGVGHVPFIEDAERFNRELADFVRNAQA